MQVVSKPNNVHPAWGAQGMREESQHVRNGWRKGQHRRLEGWAERFEESQESVVSQKPRSKCPEGSMAAT